MPKNKKYSGGARPKSRNKFWSNDTGDSDSETMESTKFCSDINQTLQAYDSNMNDFRRVYSRWLPERKNNLSKLEELVAEVHEEQLSFNKSSLTFKEVNMTSRQFKSEENPNQDFFASLAAFITDAVDGVNSIVQACNIDKHMKEFKEIMEHDAEITKPLYNARSRCFAQYHNIEEIIRQYHAETFGSTINKISQSLRTEDMWIQMKSSKNGDSIAEVVEAVDGFLQQLSRVDVNEICNSVGSYIDNNPAVLDAIESTSKAVYGAYDVWGRKRDPNERSAVSSRISSGVNNALMLRDQSEIMRLRNLTLDEDTPQAKLESKIQEAIEDLERETKEIKILFDSSRHGNTFYY